MWKILKRSQWPNKLRDMITYIHTYILAYTHTSRHIKHIHAHAQVTQTHAHIRTQISKRSACLPMLCAMTTAGSPFSSTMSSNNRFATVSSQTYVNLKQAYFFDNKHYINLSARENERVYVRICGCVFTHQRQGEVYLHVKKRSRFSSNEGGIRKSY